MDRQSPISYLHQSICWNVLRTGQKLLHLNRVTYVKGQTTLDLSHFSQNNTVSYISHRVSHRVSHWVSHRVSHRVIHRMSQCESPSEWESKSPSESPSEWPSKSPSESPSESNKTVLFQWWDNILRLTGGHGSLTDWLLIHTFTSISVMYPRYYASGIDPFLWFASSSRMTPSTHLH